MYIFRYLEIRGDVAMIDSNLPAKSEIGHHHMLLIYVYFDSLISFFFIFQSQYVISFHRRNKQNIVTV